MKQPKAASFLAVLLVCASLLVPSCSTVPYTGRSRFTLLSDQEMQQMSLESWAEIQKQHPPSKDAQKTAMIDRVGKRIAAVVERDYAWEFKLFQADDVVNAFCLPGGKVGFYTGILPVCRNEDGVAAVMGHEIAHAFAEHGNERVSQNVIAQGLMSGASLALGSQTSETKELILGALGAGAQYGVLLPYSRSHESEADEIGLRFMIRAGYNPNEAVGLWERMAELSKGKAPSEFFSTHPASEERAKRIRELIPQIMEEEKGRIGKRPGGDTPTKSIGEDPKKAIGGKTEKK
jgi:predicted Zn-dependent protease